MANDVVFSLENKYVGGTLNVYEDKVVIVRKGVISFMTHGLKGDKTIFYSNITSVQFKKGGLQNGYIQFSVKGGKESTGGLIAAEFDENSLLIHRSMNDKAEQIVEFINKKLSEVNSGGTVVQALSSADELKKFKDLLDSGIITQEEFDAKKKQLLGL